MKGNLSDQCPADVLSEIQRRQWSGILRFSKGDLVRQLFIDSGDTIRFAASTLPEESMTGLFKDRGGVLDEQLREATAAKSGEELLGTTLVRLGSLARKALNDLTEVHVRKVVHGALGLGRGQYEFQQGALPFREQLDAGLSTAELLLHWTREVPNDEWIKNRLGSPDSIAKKAHRPPQGYQEVSLDQGEGYIISRVDGTATVHEICIVSPMGDEVTLRALLGLAFAGIIEMPEGAHRQPLPPEGAAAWHRSSMASAPLPEPAAPSPRPVTPPPAPPAAQAAPPSPTPLAEHVARRAPGNGGAPKPPSPAHKPPPPQKAKPATAPRNMAGTVERVDTVQETELEKEMLKRFEHLHDKNLYDVLAIVPMATSEDIRRAYYALARRFHPDKLKDEASKAKAEKVFGHITEAYSTLSQPESRKKYDKEQERSHHPHSDKTADAAEMARQNFKHGKDLSAKGKFGEAVSFFENACEQDPSKAEYFHHLGLTQSRNPRWKKKAEESFLKAIELSPTDAQTFADLGAHYAKGGLQSKAAEMFRKALEWDPANQDAQQDLAELEGVKKGLFGSIFRKG